MRPLTSVGPASVQLGPVRDFVALGHLWRDLERRAAGSFFQSWTWVGCLASERYPDPVLVQAQENGRVVALALFNRRRNRMGLPTLHLHESGQTALDSPYIEQNGVLTEAGREAELTALCLSAVVPRYRVVLSGVESTALALAQRMAGCVALRRHQPAPFADLAALRHRGADVLEGRSANTRQQVRRSDRYYCQSGAIRIEQARTPDAALMALDRLAVLHQAAWRRRGQPGSFAEPFFRRFHAAMIQEGLPRGEIALLDINAGNTRLGVLYNFVWAGRMLAYQSGFAYQPGSPQAKPGLSSHHAAVRHALALGLDAYDFLAGDDRYKRSLADGQRTISWLACGPKWRPDLALERWRSGPALSGLSGSSVPSPDSSSPGRRDDAATPPHPRDEAD